MRIEELLMGIECNVGEKLKDVEVDGIEINLHKDLKNKAVIVFPNSLKKYCMSIDEIIQKEPSCIMIESQDVEQYDNVIELPKLRESYAIMSANFYDNPDKKLKVVLVTGTNGKTTTTHITAELLNANDIPCGVIGTLGSSFNGVHFENKLTTPDPHDMYRIMDEMVKLGAKAVCMEASAHAIYFGKLSKIECDVAVFTNCTRDHLDFFKTEENYRQTKKNLFETDDVQWQVINVDDGLGQEIMEESFMPRISYGKSRDNDISYSKVNYDGKMNFTLNIYKNSYAISTELMGEFNIYNIMASVAVAKVLGIKDDVIVNALMKVEPIDGRCNFIANELGINIVIDFSHTPDSMENIIDLAKEFTQGDIITVFGCGGNRDRGKRPIMGAVASNKSNFTIVTTDNPRYESPIDIISDIMGGINKMKSKYTIICGRQLAIEYAINKAKPGDTVLILGKGGEKTIEIEEFSFDYNDRQAVIDILNK